MRNHGLEEARVGLETDIRNSWWRSINQRPEKSNNDCGKKAFIFQRSNLRSAGRFRWNKKNFQ
jgi:hypothetical protein